jgi:hypothetical protein
MRPRRPMRPCAICGRMFWNETKRTKTCSRDCNIKLLQARVYRAEKRPSCEVCGKECNQLRRKACSKACLSILLIRARSEYWSKHRIPKITKECIICGNVFSGPSKRCSPKCAYQAVSRPKNCVTCNVGITGGVLLKRCDTCQKTNKRQQCRSDAAKRRRTAMDHALTLLKERLP